MARIRNTEAAFFTKDCCVCGALTHEHTSSFGLGVVSHRVRTLIHRKRAFVCTRCTHKEQPPFLRTSHYGHARASAAREPAFTKPIDCSTIEISSTSLRISIKIFLCSLPPAKKLRDWWFKYRLGAAQERSCMSGPQGFPSRRGCMLIH